MGTSDKPYIFNKLEFQIIVCISTLALLATQQSTHNLKRMHHQLHIK